MRNKFDEQLALLNKEMVHMGTMIEESIGKAVKALVKQDINAAKEIMNSDEEVDREQKKIENICFNLLIQQQPVARDLRTITAAMKMVTDMERIGDHAADISEMTILMSNTEKYHLLEHINKAKEVIAHDDIVDDLFDEAKKDIIDMICEDSKKGEQVTDLLLIAKYFERIGDHATNIAEWVIYSLRTSEDEDEWENK